MGEPEVESDQHANEPWFVPKIYINLSVAFRVAVCCPWRELTMRPHYHLSTCEPPGFDSFFPEPSMPFSGDRASQAVWATRGEFSQTSVPPLPADHADW
jgi:hypothetical protein